MWTFEAPGIWKTKPFGPYKNSMWLFQHGGEAAVIEMPPYRKSQRKPWNVLKKFLKEQGWNLKYALISHAHFDHCQTLPQFREAFPHTTFVGHRSQVESRVVARLAYSIRRRPHEVFDEVYDGDIRLLTLGGEALILIHCPKHSESDQFVIFRGTAMTGDWFLGDLKDCNALVHPYEKIRSVERVESWLSRLGYGVSRAFSGHGDCLYKNVDFAELLAKSKIDH